MILISSGIGRDVLAQEQANSGWSAEFLDEILKADLPKSLPATRPPSAGSAEMVSRTYSLSTLRLGEAGKTQILLAILNKVLPAGSSIKQDVAANRLHVVTTATAQKAVRAYLSAVDAPSAPSLQPAAAPDDMRAPFSKLSEAGNRSENLGEAVDALRADISKHFADLDDRQRRTTAKVIFGAVLFAIAVAATVWWTIRRSADCPGSNKSGTSAMVALAPEQMASVLAPVHDKMRADVIAFLADVAIKLQAQRDEQQKLVREQLRQMEDARDMLADERKRFIHEAGRLVAQAVERIDAVAAKLALLPEESALPSALEPPNILASEAPDVDTHQPNGIAPPANRVPPSSATTTEALPLNTTHTTPLCDITEVGQSAQPILFTFVPPDHPET